MSHRSGPTLLGPPFSPEWQASHFLKTAAPFSALAFCNSWAIEGRSSAAAAPPAAGSSVASMTKPGFSGVGEANRASDTRPIEKTTNTVPSSPPSTLLSSNESMHPELPFPADLPVHPSVGIVARREGGQISRETRSFPRRLQHL